jgi:hypothetical protein
MRYYADCLLTSEQRIALTEEGIDFSEITVGSAVYHRHGVTFPEEVSAAVTSKLGLLVDLTERAKSLTVPDTGIQVPEVSQLALVQPPTKAKPVVNASQSPEGWFRAICAEHHNRLQLGMVLSDFHWKLSSQRDVGGVLFVNCLSGPAELNCKLADDNELGGDRFVCPRTVGSEYLKILGNNRKVIALFQGDRMGGTLWFLVKLRHSESSEDLVDYVLTVVERHINPELGPAQSYREFREKGARRRYLRSAREALEEEQDSIGERVVNADQSIQEARRQLVGTLREADAARRRHEVLAGSDGDVLMAAMVKRLEKEFDALAESPDFESIDFEGSTLIVQTRPLTLVHGGRAYEFGRYKIQVSKHDLQVTSVDGVRSQGERHCCHPHVSNNYLCLGNLTESLARMQAAMQFEMLLPLVVRSMEVGYNPADSYSRIDGFLNVIARDLEVAA